ncbi:flagellar hook-associated protein FlgK [Bacillus carboniphilus]|uniref:Flagellar hook-associated protein 1 n=1 Tax=Bacillus carboniphilus TaxID=86663 RepID=A0ABY9JRP5_9BACI|nr:flagellar hook-associated protein FlgK [Bacillus carboniphilus]WLR41489.1 flagellar hook-associated protein FlgK [Bacillus carboniphilus]
MTSSFFGLETARRGLYAQQSSLQTISNNIANANTEGYVRQRVSLKQTNPYTYPSTNQSASAGQIGTGVTVQTIERVKDDFLTMQFRSENNQLGYWSSKSDTLQMMEEVLNEPSSTGLSSTLDEFWSSLEDLATNPTNSGARSVVRERGIAVAETFNYISQSLSSIQTDLKNDLQITTEEVNSLTRQISNINEQITSVEPNGLLPNSLYDERDLLLDQLSSLVDIKVTKTPVGGNALDQAEGIVSVDIVDQNGKAIHSLIEGDRVNMVSVDFDENTNLVSSLSIGTTDIQADEYSSVGKLMALVESYGYMEGAEQKGLYPEMTKKLDEMAFTFVNEFNATHEQGWSLAEIEQGSQDDFNFFNELTKIQGAASLMKVSEDMYDNNNIAAAESQFAGDGANAIKLAEVKNSSYSIGGQTRSLQNFYESMIGEMAVNTQEAERMKGNSETLTNAVTERRQSVTSVSLDEEMTNMIQFQHAYNAAAKMISAQDELLSTIINNLGVGGR